MARGPRGAAEGEEAVWKRPKGRDCCFLGHPVHKSLRPPVVSDRFPESVFWVKCVYIFT